ncbi:MAG TPA: c-type cytochrome biogenesis protein CcmI [Pseudorhodoplanes sp.]|nr:c-type cytochrome biogenesis protein CcmI [Pseudorhodoplanes sp.]
MTLWFVLALMTMAAIFAVLWPLARVQTAASGSEVAIYRDQLEEIERDRAAGLIAAAEAEAARTEVARRLIAAADAAEPAMRPSIRARRTVAVCALLGLPAAAVTLYLLLGSPGLPGAPLALRETRSPDQQSIASMVAQVEAHLEKNPEDGRGWEVLAPVYLRAGRFEDAVRARRNALRLLGATPAREADLGEALTAAANGIVTSEAKTAFERAAAADPNGEKAQFFLGLAAEQDGRSKEAADIWRRLLARADAGAPWRPAVEQALARLQVQTFGPDAADIAAAEKLSPEQRAAMISGMVERLAARLKEDGSDIGGWLRLVRAYMVLGETDKAREALADARSKIQGDPEKLRKIDDLARALGLGG